MDHAELKEKLYAYHDNELRAQERVEITDHLSNCDSCRSELQTWKKISQSMFRREPIEPSESFVAAVMDRIDPQTQTNPATSWWDWLWEIPAFGLGFAALMFLFSFHSIESATSIEAIVSSDAGRTESLKWISQSNSETAEEALDFSVEDL